MNHGDTRWHVHDELLSSLWRRPEHSGQNVGKIFSSFLAGEESFTKTGVCGWQQGVTQSVPFRSSGGNGVHSVVSFQDFYVVPFCILRTVITHMMSLLERFSLACTKHALEFTCETQPLQYCHQQVSDCSVECFNGISNWWLYVLYVLGHPGVHGLFTYVRIRTLV